MTSRRTITAFLGLGLVLAASCSAPDADKSGGPRRPPALTLTMASAAFDQSEVAEFVEQVSHLSGGTIRVEVKGGWRAGQLDAETGLIHDVRAGQADLGWTGSRAWDSVGVQGLRALHAPLLIDSSALQERVVSSPLAADMLRDLEPLGVVGLGILPGPMRKPLGVTRPLVKPADYASLRIGVGRSAVADETMRALGAIPVTVPFGGGIEGLDGIEHQLSAIQGNHYDRAGQYVTANVSLWPRPLVLFANRGRYDSLSDTQQHALQQAVVNAIPGSTAMARRSEAEAAGVLCRRGLVFLSAAPQEIAALRRAVQPVYEQLAKDPRTADIIRRIEAMRVSGSPAADVPPGCSVRAAGTDSGEPTSLDGVYRVTTTAQELRATGSPDAQPENWGTWTYVFDRGRFAFTQENRQACSWGYGTFAVDGNQVTWTFEDGGGIDPNGAFNRPGELFVFGWSLYRETLTLTPVSGAISPENFRVKPWPRIATTPSARQFSRRCPPPARALPRDVSGAAGPIEGIWEAKVSRAEYAAAGADAAELATAGNYGDMRLELRGGAWTLRVDEVAGGGTYVVEGDKVTLRQSNGETFVFRWSIFRDALSFERVPDAASPTGFVVKPWRRVS